MIEAAPVRVRLDEMLSKRGMTLTELSARVDVTVVNLSILKNGRARAIRFSTLARCARRWTASPATCSATTDLSTRPRTERPVAVTAPRRR